MPANVLSRWWHSLFQQVDVTKKNKEDFNSPPREGAYVHGLFMEGARWDTQTGMIAESRLKELTPGMPVMFIRAIPVDKQETKNVYECPVYKTRQRGPTYVWNFFLKTKESPAKWTLAGVALLLSVWKKIVCLFASVFPAPLRKRLTTVFGAFMVLNYDWRLSLVTSSF